MPPESCPWHDWTPGTVAFCEARLCEVVREPANAWSSAAYLVLAIYMLRAKQAPHLVVLAQVMIGIGSFFFHATGTFAGELVDQVGMFILSALILAYALGERQRWSQNRIAGFWALTVGLSGLTNVLVPPIGIPLFAVQLFTGLSLQLSLGGRDAPPRYSDLRWGIGIFLFSFAIWLTDITRVVCAPDFHWFNGHAAWHILNAVSIALLGRFFNRAPR